MIEKISKTEIEELLETQPKKYIEDIVSLLHIIDYFQDVYIENQTGDVVENALSIGILLDSINRFAHSIMDELIENKLI